MTRRRRGGPASALAAALVPLAFLGLGAALADDAARGTLHVLIDVSHAPGAGSKALVISDLVMTWYPRIDAILGGPGHRPAYDQIAVIIDPNPPYPAFASGNVIHVSARALETMRDDYRAMVIHELTHVAQRYPKTAPEASWLVEGIADYVRHRHFEADITETLRLGENGAPTGYGPGEPFLAGLETRGVSLDRQGYRQGYTVAAAFLRWLEVNRNPRAVPLLHRALSAGAYDPRVFAEAFGAPLDDLWAAFIAASKATSP